jgi:hypothetical protein
MTRADAPATARLAIARAKVYPQGGLLAAEAPGREAHPRRSVSGSMAVRARNATAEALSSIAQPQTRGFNQTPKEHNAH